MEGGPLMSRRDLLVAVLIFALMGLLLGLDWFSVQMWSSPPPVWMFHFLIAGIAILAALMTFILLERRSVLLLPLLAITVLLIRLYVALRTPPSLLAYGDLTYEYQLVRDLGDTGTLHRASYSGRAGIYVIFPALEILIASFAQGMGVDSMTVLKYAGAPLGVLTMLLAWSFSRTIIPDERVAGFAAFAYALSPFLLQFDVYAVHQTLALSFFVLFMISLLRPGISWRLVGLASILLVFFTHHLTGIILVAVVLGYLLLHGLARLVGKRALPLPPGLAPRFPLALNLSVPLVLILLMFAQFGLVSYVLTGLVTYTSGSAAGVIQSDRPPWQVLLIGAGLSSYVVVVLLALRGIRKRKKPAFRWASILSIMGAILFVGIYTLGVFVGLTGLLGVKWRGMIYFYLFSAPFVGWFLVRALSRPRTHRLRAALALGVVALLVPTGVYFGYYPDYYDTAAPYRTEDLRLDIPQWTQAGYFAQDHVSQVKAVGVLRGGTYVGGLGQMGFDFIRSMDDLASADNVTVKVLRFSMSEVPERDILLSPAELEEIVHGMSTFYRAGDALLGV
jgi:hypothetical protein